MVKKTVINGQWDFFKNTLKREVLPYSQGEKIDLPHTWNGIDGQDGGSDYYRGVCWYRKEIKLDSADNGLIYLEFEGVNSICEVYVDGDYCFRHEGGYSGFRVDVSAYANNLIVLEIAVDNRHDEAVYPLFADFTFYGGIYRNVNVLYVPAVHFEKNDLGSCGVFVRQVDVSKTLARVNIDATVVNLQEESDIVCQVRWLDAQNKVVQHVSKQVVGYDRSQVSFDMVIENPVLWEGIENPYLYQVEMSLVVKGTLYETMTIPTGLRFFEFDEEKGFFLNGRNVKLNGVSRHQDWVDIGNALLPEHHQKDIELIKEIGANSIRLAHYQHDQYFYDLCDEAGMIVWAEIPYISKTSETDSTASNAILQMRELIRQSYNHPSIIMWGVQNEIGIGNETKTLEQIVREIHDVVKEEDTTRVTTQAQVMMTEEEDPAHYVTDIVAWNKYYGWYVGATEEFEDFIHSFREKNPNRAFGISEYGAEGILKWHSEEPKVKDYSEEYHALYHETAWTIFNKYSYIWGTYVWNMFDFGSDMRDEGGVQGRNNKGLVTFDRKIRKDAFYFYQSVWSKVPMLHLCGRRFTERHLEVIKIKVYSNQSNVTLTNNGIAAEVQKKNGTVWEFNVHLEQGENTLIAEASELRDIIVLMKVDEQNKNYVLPQSESKGLFDGIGGNVKNWFEEDSAEPLLIEYKDGYYSIKDKIKEILENPEGETVLREYMEGFFEHPMFKMASSMSLKQIFDFQSDAFPHRMQVSMNKALSSIAKN